MSEQRKSSLDEALLRSNPIRHHQVVGVIDYSPSPEDAKPAGVAGAVAPIAGAAASLHESPAHAPATNGEARSGMKVTLKRHSHANGKDSSW